MPAEYAGEVCIYNSMSREKLFKKMGVFLDGDADKRLDFMTKELKRQITGLFDNGFELPENISSFQPRLPTYDS